MPNDGGPAFPRPTNDTMVDADEFAYEGMSLLDYFAGHALAGLLAMAKQKQSFAEFSDDAYDMAEAMLKERERRSETE